MQSLNLCQFIGNLGRDPETRFTADGSAVTNLSLACGWKTKEKEGTEWIRIVAFGKLAEIMDKYLKKGSQVYISGSMRTREWTDKDGAKKYTTEIVADQMKMLGGKSERDSESNALPTQTANASDDNDSDIPF